MSNWVVILLGIVEGITEFLPISSTGHLLLVEHGLNLPVHPSELFNVVIQSGAVMAVLLAFSDRLARMWVERRDRQVQAYLLKLATAFVITAIGGLILKKMDWKLPETPVPVAWATLIGGIVILALEWGSRGRTGSTQVTWLVAVAVGLAQVLAAAYPGTSRSGASMLIAMAIGLARPAAIEFSFLVGVPTLLAAGGYSALSALRDPSATHEPVGQILLGMLVSAITAFLAVRWLLRYVQTHTLVPFGWYRIVLGGLILLLAGRSH